MYKENKIKGIKTIELFLKEKFNSKKSERENLIIFASLFEKIDLDKHLKQFDKITKRSGNSNHEYLDGYDKMEMIINMTNIINESNGLDRSNMDDLIKQELFIYPTDINEYKNRDDFFIDHTVYISVDFD